MSAEPNPSRYLRELPAVFQEDRILRRYLLAFEALLSGLPAGSLSSEQAAAAERILLQPPLERVIENLDAFFRPYSRDGTRQAPAEFLPWLAGWAALNLRADWDETTRRQFLQEVVSLYRLRGTKAGLHRLLQLYVGQEVPITIYDGCDADRPPGALRQIFDGDGSFRFEPPPHYFQVEMTLKDRDPVLLQRKQLIAMAIIEQEKPAHTFYALRINVPTMRLPFILGKGSLLGTENI